MKSCEHLRDVEALRDGRIAPEQLADVERHIAQCSVCAAEQAALHHLAEQLRALPNPKPDPFRQRRRRAELLADLSRGGPPSKRRTPLVGIALAACAALVWLGISTRTDQEQTAAVAAQAEVVITPDRGAIYTRKATSQGIEVRLTEGRIALRVRGSSERSAVIVRTPDGEVVDRGTIFSVSVLGQRTREVAVQEGKVWVSLQDRPSRLVVAGESYHPYPELDHTVAPMVVLEAEEDAAVAPATLANDTRRTPPTSLRKLSKRNADEMSARGVQALEEQRALDASRDFAAFCAHFSADPRAEDAAYLAVVAFSRAGRDAEARRAAARYLARYPKGLRAHEVSQRLGAH
jgi:hypothetical protein